MHRLGVDPGHHEGAHPAAGDRVLVGGVPVRLGHALEAGGQGKRIGQQHPHGRVLLGGHHGGHAAGEGAAGEGALHAPDPSADPPGRRAEAGGGLPLNVPDAQVKGDGIEAAGEDQPRAGSFCGGLVSGDHLGDPVGLAGQVHIVAARRGAGGHQGRAIELIGSGGGDHGLRPGGQRGQSHGVRPVGSDQRQVGGGADQVADLRQLGGAAPGHGPFHRPGRPVGLQQILRHQPPGEAGGTIDDDVEVLGSGGHGRFLACLSGLWRAGYATGGSGQPASQRP